MYITLCLYTFITVNVYIISFLTFTSIIPLPFYTHYKTILLVILWPNMIS